MTRWVVLVAFGVAFAIPPVEARRNGRATLPVIVHMGAGADGPVRSRDWMREQVVRANEVFQPSGLSFRVVDTVHLSAWHAHLNTRQDRHSLGRLLRPRAINVFVVDSMRDVDDPSQWRRGVHWRVPNARHRHFVVLTSIGPPTTLAHELGHYFGNREHRMVTGNIMSYDHGPTPRFDPDQLQRVIRSARDHLYDNRLVTFATWERITLRDLLRASR